MTGSSGSNVPIMHMFRPWPISGALLDPTLVARAIGIIPANGGARAILLGSM